MELDPVFLSRLQFAFVISFHIIFPAFTIGLGAWLATIEGARLVTGNAVYRRVFDFWLKIFALSFGILANNSWMQVRVGHTIVDGKIIPADWWAIVTGPVMMVRWPHMLLAAFLTTGMCVASTGAWYVLRNVHRAEARVMLHWGLAFVALVIPLQLFFGHLTGLYVLTHQPAKFAAIEARWKNEQPASE